MPAKDLIHDAVRNALEKDGWIITDDPLTLEYEDVQVFVDLGAERVLGAERNGEKIAVEVKSFIGPSVIHNLRDTLGQYDIYESFLRRIEPDRYIFVAISQEVYLTLFQSEAIQMLIDDHKLPLLIIDTDSQEVVQWIKPN